MSGSKLSPFAEKHSPVEFRIALGARAEAVIGERRLMGIDEGHAVGGADRGTARRDWHSRERLQLRQEFALAR